MGQINNYSRNISHENHTVTNIMSECIRYIILYPSYVVPRQAVVDSTRVVVKGISKNGPKLCLQHGKATKPHHSPAIQ